jgi:hypothetical protein
MQISKKKVSGWGFEPGTKNVRSELIDWCLVVHRVRFCVRHGQLVSRERIARNEPASLCDLAPPILGPRSRRRRLLEDGLSVQRLSLFATSRPA